MEERARRRPSEGNIYHVFSRGSGKQIIFESDKDRNVFLKILGAVLEEVNVELFAWCLMDNHFHFLLHGSLDDIARLMQNVLGQYARYFNGEHNREGHLFESRYGSEPIDTDEYLMQAVRYIHQNPEKAQIAYTDRYRWSSYQEYVHVPKLATTAPLLETFGTVASFVNFHALDSRFCLREYNDRRGDAAAKRALNIAIDEVGDYELNNFRSLSRSDRANRVTRLANRGLTYRQIERLTGTSRKTIAQILQTAPLSARPEVG